ncbi:hypothetical protein HY642_02610 [Candidatus Woesearchaeota archaeon]|nr:hypothetical protein [Candidatus Woesearchaeota archaeon]
MKALRVRFWVPCAALLTLLLAQTVLADAVDWSKKESFTQENVLKEPEQAYAANRQLAVTTAPAILERSTIAKDWFTGDGFAEHITEYRQYAAKYFETPGNLAGAPGEKYLGVLANGKITFDLKGKTLAVTGKGLSNADAVLEDITAYPAGTTISPSGEGFEIKLPHQGAIVAWTITGSAKTSYKDGHFFVNGKQFDSNTDAAIEVLPHGFRVNDNPLFGDFKAVTLDAQTVKTPTKTIETKRLQIEFNAPLVEADPSSTMLTVKFSETVQYAGKEPITKTGIVFLNTGPDRDQTYGDIALQGDTTAEFGRSMVTTFKGGEERAVDIYLNKPGFTVIGSREHFFASTTVPVIEGGKQVGTRTITMPTQAGTLLAKEMSAAVAQLEEQAKTAQGEDAKAVKSQLDYLKAQRADLGSPVVAASFFIAPSQDLVDQNTKRPKDGNLVYAEGKLLTYGVGSASWEESFTGTPERDFARTIAGTLPATTLQLEDSTVTILDNPVATATSAMVEATLRKELAVQRLHVNNLMKNSETKNGLGWITKQMQGKSPADMLDAIAKEGNAVYKTHLVLMNERQKLDDKLRLLHDVVAANEHAGYIDFGVVTDVHGNHAYGIVLSQSSITSEPATVKASRATLVTQANAQVKDQNFLVISDKSGTLAEIRDGNLKRNYLLGRSYRQGQKLEKGKTAITGGESAPTHWYADITVEAKDDSLSVDINDYEDAIRDLARGESPFVEVPIGLGYTKRGYALDLLETYQKERSAGRVALDDVASVTISNDVVVMSADIQYKAPWKWTGAADGTGKFNQFGEYAAELAAHRAKAELQRGNAGALFGADYTKLADQYIPGLGKLAKDALSSAQSQFSSQSAAIDSIDKLYGAKVIFKQEGGNVVVTAAIIAADTKGNSVQPTVTVQIPLSEIPEFAGKDFVQEVRKALKTASEERTIPALKDKLLQQAKEGLK